VLLAVGGASIAVAGVFWILSGGVIVRRLDVDKLVGIGLAKNQLGHAFALTVVAAAFLALRGGRSHVALLWWLAAALCAGGTLATGSRSSALGAIGGVLILVVVAFPRQ